jgi:hypothetical protein
MSNNQDKDDGDEGSYEHLNLFLPPQLAPLNLKAGSHVT